MKAGSDGGSRVFVTDCEGPITKNDNAFELARQFVPNGDKFFALISKYDDVLADVIKKPGYGAGSTLKLIVPFLKAHGATNDEILEYSSRNMLIVPGGKGTLQFVSSIMPSFIVSTSYRPYIEALCDIVDFPIENAYCTELDIDSYVIEGEEVEELKKLGEEIAAMQMIQIPDGAESIEDFSKRDKETIERLDEIFWEKIPKMDSGKILNEIDPVDSEGKVEAVHDIVEKLGVDLRDLMYVGDSITDSGSLKLVKEGGGMAVSFNGNEYAVREAEVAVLAENTVVASVLAYTFKHSGKRGVLRLVENWSLQGLKKYCKDISLVERVIELYPEALPEVEKITQDNQKILTKKSENFRSTVRGEAVGKLG